LFDLKELAFDWSLQIEFGSWKQQHQAFSPPFFPFSLLKYLLFHNLESSPVLSSPHIQGDEAAFRYWKDGIQAWRKYLERKGAILEAGKSLLTKPLKENSEQKREEIERKEWKEDMERKAIRQALRQGHNLMTINVAISTLSVSEFSSPEALAEALLMKLAPPAAAAPTAPVEPPLAATITTTTTTTTVAAATNTTETDDDACKICFERKINSVLIPCGHMVTCFLCAKLLAGEATPKCPICRGNVDGIFQTFKV
jgi:hypothetical protein